MKRLVFPTAPEVFYRDIDRIVSVCAAAGYAIDRETAAWAWMDAAADEGCDGWMLTEHFRDSKIVRLLVEFCAVIDPPTTPVDGPASVAWSLNQETER